MSLCHRLSCIFLFCFVFICLIESKAPSNPKEAMDQMKLLLGQLVASIPHAISYSDTKELDDISISNALQLCAVSMTSVYYPNSKVFPIEINEYQAFKPTTHHDDLIASDQFYEIKVFTNPEEYVPFLTMKQYQAMKCVHQDVTWILLGREISDSTNPGLGRKIIDFTDESFPTIPFRSIWKSGKDNSTYFIYEKELIKKDRKVAGTVSTLNRDEYSNNVQFQKIYDELKINFRTSSKIPVIKEYVDSGV